MGNSGGQSQVPQGGFHADSVCPLEEENCNHSFWIPREGGRYSFHSSLHQSFFDHHPRKIRTVTREESQEIVQLFSDAIFHILLDRSVHCDDELEYRNTRNHKALTSQST